MTGKRTSKIAKALLGMNPHCDECEIDIGADEEGVVKVLFCPDCGGRLKKPSLCVICGNPVNAMAVFCTGCGVKIIREEESNDRKVMSGK